MDDSSYNSFLESANQTPKAPTNTSTHGSSTSQARSSFDPTTSSSALPASLKSLTSEQHKIYYTSDTDEAFVPVFLNYSGDKLPSLKDFEACWGKTTGKQAESGEVEELEVEDFDPRGEYKEIVERVACAGQEMGKSETVGDSERGVKVFRVQLGTTRCEYYVLSVGDRGLVGVKVKAVES